MALFIKRATHPAPVVAPVTPVKTAVKARKKRVVKKKVRRTRIPRKSAILVVEKPRNIIQDYAAIDQFGEVPSRKREAEKKARDLGHALMPWHERPSDPAGRFNAFCTSCNKAVVVCTETPPGFPDIYGPAFTTECPVVSSGGPE